MLIRGFMMVPYSLFLRTCSFVSLYEEWLAEDTNIVNDGMVSGRETYINVRAMAAV